MLHPPSRDPDPSALRRRARSLTELAGRIERSLAMSLPEQADAADWTGSRARLCRSMLDRNLHQLHRASDDLRSVAHRLRVTAAELDGARGLVT